MNVQGWTTRCWLLILCLITLAHAGENKTFPRPAQAAKSEPQVERISAQELRTKLSRNEPVTILDVRATDSYVNSDNRIKGSMHVKLRRLEFRLSMPPLKSIPRDSEVITYCACPHDEASIRAAQILLGAGFKRVRVLAGGWQDWLRANGQVEPRPKA